MDTDIHPRIRGSVLAIFFLSVFLTGKPAHAFHYGGIGDCEGCHHTKEPSDNPFNLKGIDPSSTCLRCHERKAGAPTEEHHVSTAAADMPGGIPPSGLSPAGDFGWLKKSYEGEPGEVHGHNIIAEDFGYHASSIALAPGGSYPSDSLHCTSCHDPHGRYRRNADGTITSSGFPIKASGSYANSPAPLPEAPVGVYRLLGGKGHQAKSSPDSTPFTRDPPNAVSPQAYNRSEEISQTRVAYGSGMSEWCGNCHVAMHGSKMSHPTGSGARFREKISANYNAYVRTSDLSGSKSNSYLSLVPFEEGSSDYDVLKPHARSDDYYREGPDEKANVFCLSCHRAHASGWKSILRFDIGAAFITISDDSGIRYPDKDRIGEPAKGRSAEEIEGAYYGRPAKFFGAGHRSLCGKCHIKD